MSSHFIITIERLLLNPFLAITDMAKSSLRLYKFGALCSFTAGFLFLFCGGFIAVCEIFTGSENISVVMLLAAFPLLGIGAFCQDKAEALDNKRIHSR